MDDRHKLGQKGEKLAEKYLRGKGYRIRARNYRASHGQGELDIIAQHKDTIVFVEVRTQSSDRYGPAFDVFSRTEKQHRISSAKDYLYRYRLMDKPYRFDFIQIVITDSASPTIDHIENAF